MSNKKRKKEETPMIKIGVPCLNESSPRSWIMPDTDEFAFFEEVLEIVPYGNSGICLLKSFDGKFTNYRLIIVDIKHNVHITNANNKETMFLSTRYSFSKDELAEFVSTEVFSKLLKLDEKWRKNSKSKVLYYNRIVSCKEIEEKGITSISNEYFYGLLAERLGENPTVSFEDYMRLVLFGSPVIKTPDFVKKLFKEE